MHLMKMPLKYWGMIPSRSGPWGLRSGGHHDKKAGTKKDVGIKYILRRNSIWGGLKQPLKLFNL